MLKNLREDTRRLREIKTKPFPFYVLESLLFENGYQAVVLHRIAHWFKSRRVPALGPFFARLSLLLTSVDIAPGARIGPGLFISHGAGGVLFISHGAGLVIGNGVRIGRNGTLLHQVTIGAPTGKRLHLMPTLGDNVFVGAGRPADRQDRDRRRCVHRRELCRGRGHPCGHEGHDDCGPATGVPVKRRRAWVRGLPWIAEP